MKVWINQIREKSGLPKVMSRTHMKHSGNSPSGLTPYILALVIKIIWYDWL
jgi:hypothetical protein